jgi:hypothetical protein
MALLIEQGTTTMITEEVLMAAATNTLWGVEIMALLLEQAEEDKSDGQT